MTIYGAMSPQSENSATPGWHATTILSVRKGGHVVMAGDGQVSMGQTIVKGNAKKVRRLGNGQIVAGFAGSTADAFTLFERLEAKLERHPGQLAARLHRARQGLAHRPLPAPAGGDDGGGRQGRLAAAHRLGRRARARGGVIAIGSGGNYALAAARALIDVEGLDAEAIARKAMDIAADICVYTNHNLVDREALKSVMSTRLFPPRNRLRTRQAHRRPAGRQARRRDRAAQPLAPAAAAEALREEVMPKNILMIGPTGCGKTEIARRLARLANAPFLKVEATKFTEVGYVGRDVEQIVRDLMEVAIDMTRETPAQGRARQGRACRRGSRARCAVRHRRQRGDAAALPQQAARRRA